MESSPRENQSASVPVPTQSPLNASFSSCAPTVHASETAQHVRYIRPSSARPGSAQMNRASIASTTAKHAESSSSIVSQTSSSPESQKPAADSFAKSSNKISASANSTSERPFCAEDDESFSLGQSMIAGALAGITEHVAMYPIDTVKTRMQSYVAIRDHASGVFHTTRTIISTEGLSALWRGVSAVAISAGPAHALYFATYESVRKFLERSLSMPQTQFSLSTSGSAPSANDVNPIATSLAGACATVIGDGIMTPLDVVKQRMQVTSRTGGGYTSVWQCLRHVYSYHGFSAFYAGYKATLLMNIPFTAVYFTAYELAKRSILDARHIDVDQFSASSHCVAGAFAGGIASAATNPLDVVKTRLQTQGEIGARRYRGLVDALRVIRDEEGMKGLMRGVRPRVLFHMPAAAVCWTTYEFCKHIFKKASFIAEKPASSLSSEHTSSHPEESNRSR